MLTPCIHVDHEAACQDISAWAKKHGYAACALIGHARKNYTEHHQKSLKSGPLHYVGMFETRHIEQPEQMAAWYRSLPSKTLIIANGITVAERIQQALHPIVPPIISLGDEEALALLLRPSISAIPFNFHRVGTCAIDTLIAPTWPPESPATAIPPLQIRPRQSTQLAELHGLLYQRIQHTVEKSFPQRLSLADLATALNKPVSTITVQLRSENSESPGALINRTWAQLARRAIHHGSDPHELARIGNLSGKRGLQSFFKRWLDAK